MMDESFENGRVVLVASEFDIGISCTHPRAI